MTGCIREIAGVTYIDMLQLWQGAQAVSVAQRLREIFILSGVRFFDDECRFVNKPVVAITGFGGFPVSFSKDTPDDCIVVNGRAASPTSHLEEMQKTRGMAGFVTNLNSGKHSAQAMDEITTKLGHFSKLRANVLDFHVFGYPAAIEPNFMRLYKYAEHVGCLTQTRTSAQSNPPWVVLDPRFLPAAQAMYASLSLPVPSQDMKGEALRDFQEEVYGWQPKNAAMMLMLNIDLANLRATMRDIADEGQEIAWRRILALANDQLHRLFPALFEETSLYGFTPPVHWEDI